MAHPVEKNFDSDKAAILKALPTVTKSLDASVHGFHANLGLASILFNDGRLLYLHIIEKNTSKTMIRYAPSISYLADKDVSVIPQEDIDRVNKQLRSVVG